MKFLLLISLNLFANEPKKIEWFPNNSQDSFKNLFSCEGHLEKINSWKVKSNEDKPLETIEYLKSIGQTASCKFFDLKF